MNNFYQRDNKIFLRELDAVSQFPDLSWRWHNDIPILKGRYQFNTEFRGILFQDSFILEFNFPPDYPERLPLVKEVDYKIPKTFHRLKHEYLCLCTFSEQWLIFSKEPTLDNYIRNLLNPYLLSWLWFVRFNEMPWGERRHGSIGLVESYQDLLKTKSIQQTIFLMKKAIMDGVGRQDKCPCGSGLSFKKCHQKIIQRLVNSLPEGQMAYDFKNILLEALT